MDHEYDGFISYSHAADGLLAPRLQAGLQRFAKPWWKRRALRVFRDESSLSANPHLWSSITEALDTSGWFVLLLSPDAAQSEWVNQEVAYWVEHKDPDRILPVLTNGEFGWTGGDVTGDSVPVALRGFFEDEPRWVDLRFAKGEDQLDLKDPRFADAVADVASAMRGVPKDELASEEVRQHRRTVRTAWAAGALVVVLAVAASLAALFAVQQRDEAEASAQDAAEAREEALDSAESARQEADRADHNFELARASEQEAIEAAAVARSRELIAAAVSQQAEDPELSMILALESIAAAPPGPEPPPAGVIALRQAISDNRVARRLPVPWGLLSVRLSQAGETAYYASVSASVVAAVDVASGEELWSYADPATVDRFTRIDLSPDGALLAVSIEDLASPDDPDVAVDEVGHDDRPTRVVVLDTSDGSVRAELFPGACDVGHSSGFSPDGQLLAVSAGGTTCRTDPAESWVGFYDTTTWEEVERLTIDGGLVEEVSFADDMNRLVAYEANGQNYPGARLFSWPDLTEVLTVDAVNFASISPDGSRAVVFADTGRLDFRPQLIDLEDGNRISFLDHVDGFLIPDIDKPFSFSPDGTSVFVATRTHDYLYDAVDGQLLLRLGARAPTTSHGFSGDGRRLAAATSEGSIVVFDLEGGAADAGVDLAFPEHNAAWINPNQVVDGPGLAIAVLTRDRPSVWDIATGVIDPETGTVAAAFPGSSVQVADGRFVTHPWTPADDPAGADSLIGPLTVWDPESGATQDLTSCSVIASSFDLGTPPPCEGDELLWGESLLPFPGLASSGDGSVVAAHAFVPEGTPRPVRVWDGDTLEVVSEFTVPWDYQLVEAGPEWLGFRWWQREELAFYSLDGELLGTQGDIDWGLQGASSPDGSLLYSFGVTGNVDVLDPLTAEVLASWPAHATALRGGALSADGARLITTGEDDFVNIWDVSAIEDLTDGTPPPLLDRIPAPTPADAAWIDDETILVFLSNGARMLEVSLKVDDVLAQARERVTRGFEPDECVVFGFEDCPTIEDLRNG